MLKIFSVVTLLTLAGCANVSPYGGFSYHDTSLDRPEIDLCPVLGFVGAEYKGDNWGDVSLFGEHTSGICTTEAGAGLNQVGIIFRK